MRKVKSSKIDLAPIIAIPLKPLTVATEIVVTITLLLFLVVGCQTIEGIDCSVSHLPMISDILKVHMYDRIFVMGITFHSYFIFFGNVRAFYTRFQGVFNPNVNTTLYWLGVAAAVAIPFVGIIDEKVNDPVHSTFAVIFFICGAIYVILFVTHLKSLGPDILNPEELKAVVYLEYLRGFIVFLIVFGIGCAAYFGAHGPTPYFEWTGTIALLDSFMLMAQLDNEVEVVIPQKDLKN